MHTQFPQKADRALRLSSEPGASSPGSWEHFLVTRSVDGIVVVGTDGRICEFNAAAERIFRRQAKEVLGQLIECLLPSRLQGHHRELVGGFFDQERVGREMRDREPVSAVRADGEEFFADIALIPITIRGQRAVACVVRDITERIDAEAAALQSEKLESLRMLSAGLAHDFNNILTTIIGNAEVVAAEIGPDSAAFLPLHDIRQASQRAAEMVQQMLRFAGRGTSLRETEDVSSVIVEMCRLLRNSLKPQVSAFTDVEPALPPVRGDPTEIRRIVMNLVVNASEAIGENPGRIVVGAKVVHADRRTLRACYGASRATPGSFVCIEVSDTGPGMDRTTRSRIFDPFFSTKFTGRGLGLASVLGIVRGLEGGIRLQSRVGKGSTFKVLLPIAEPLES